MRKWFAQQLWKIIRPCPALSLQDFHNAVIYAAWEATKERFSTKEVNISLDPLVLKYMKKKDYWKKIENNKTASLKAPIKPKKVRKLVRRERN